MRKFFGAFAANPVFANITILLFFMLGGVALLSTTREMFPEFSLDRIVVTVAYPGADPEEVEEGVLQKIEEAVEGLDGVKEIQTVAEENLGTAVITLTERADAQKVLDQVRTHVDAINTFPVDAENPVVSELTLSEPVVILGLSGEMGEKRIKEWAERTKDALTRLPEISVVEVMGVREYEISVEVSNARLREFGLTLEDVRSAIRRNNLNLPGGLLRSENEELRIRTLGRKYTGEELAGIVVATRASGERVLLEDVAEIIDGFAEDPVHSRVDRHPAVFLYVNKTPEQDALVISRATQTFLKEQQGFLPEGLSMTCVIDTTDMLRARINLLVRNGLVGLVLVFLLLWVFLDLRLSFWAGMGMPISIAGALAILWGIGGTINMISLFGLIMVLGIIVDDAIVVGESIYHHHQIGDKPLHAAVSGVTEVGMPVLGAVTTTIVAFLPLMFVGGIMGKFISILPKVVIACLVVSLIECLFLLPAHLGQNPLKRRTGHTRLLARFHDAMGRGLERFVAGPYARFLRLALSWRYVSLAVAVAILLMVGGMIQGGLVSFRMFPKFDSFILTATVEFPQGTPVNVTEEALDHIETATYQLNEQVPTKDGRPVLEHVLRQAGRSLGANTPGSGPQIGSVQLILVPSELRSLDSDKIQKLWEKNIGTIAGAEALSLEGLNAGPPGRPIDVQIRGESLERMQEVAEVLKTRLATFAGVTQIQSSLRPGKNEFTFTLKPEADSLGLSVEDLGRQLAHAYYGAEALRIQRGRDDIRVMVRTTAEERGRVSALRDLRIRTRDGREVPLFSVADVSLRPGFSTITRVDGLRTIGVSADVDKAVANSGEINAVLEQQVFPELMAEYPDIFLKFQGEQKDSEESVASLKIGFPLALVGIFIIIATLFRSYVQTLLIMVTVPFGIIGAVLGHLALGYDLSLMSMFGIVALAGVVVNDAIVLIESINHHLAEGYGLYESIHRAGQRRFRAVFLTTLSTVGGLTPLILVTDLQARFLIPMALSIAAGVAFATLLTLLLIPSLFAILNDIRCGIHFLVRGNFPKDRRDVEPALKRSTETF